MYRTDLHQASLRNFQKDGEHLVVIWRVQIHPECSEYTYPYDYGGIEGPVSKLSQMEGGFHAWDIHAMLKVH